MADLYDVLGVEQSASDEEIKRAYRRKAREHHPDAGGDEERFKEVTHAYQVLSDREKRARYDRFGDDGTTATRSTSDPFGFSGGGFGGIGDVIDAFFGGGFTQGGSRRRGPAPGRDVLVGVEIDLEEVATGTRTPVAIDVAVVCDVCGGAGSTSGAGRATCGTCSGNGQVQRLVRTAFGQLATATTCPACNGEGSTIADPCTGCAGEGRRLDHRSITVDVPAGVEHGDRLRVSGAGEAGRHGGPSGDLYVEIQLREHEWFDRDGRDLWSAIRVPITQVTLGAELVVPLLGGDEEVVTVPRGSQHGDVLTIRRAGLPDRRGATGDLHLRVEVEIPRDLDEEQESLLRSLAELRDEDVGEKRPGILGRLRQAFN